MCKFCERAGVIVSEITVDKYSVTSNVKDPIFGEVVIGKNTVKKQPMITLKTNKGIIRMPMPVKFDYCPHCGRKI